MYTYTCCSCLQFLKWCDLIKEITWVLKNIQCSHFVMFYNKKFKIKQKDVCVWFYSCDRALVLLRITEMTVSPLLLHCKLKHE